MEAQTLKQAAKAIATTPKGAFLSIDTRTIKPVAKCRGGGELVTVNKGILVQSRTSYMKRRVQKEPDFELSPRKWGSRVADSDIIEHNGKLYLETIADPESKVAKPETTYFHDGEKVSHERARELCPRKDSSPIMVRVFSSDSITAIRAGGQTFT